MATILQLKRSSGTAAPSELAQGELAYTYGTGAQGNNGDRLFIGTGTETNGVAANIDIIGGKYFANLADHVHGTLTASSALITDSNNAIDQLLVGNNATAGGGIKFNEATNNGAHSVLLKSPAALVGDVVLTLPAAAGTNGQFLKTDGSGNLSFGGVYSSDRQESVDAHDTNNTILLTVSGVQIGSIDSNSTNLHGLSDGDILFDNNLVTTTLSNSDLELRRTTAANVVDIFDIEMKENNFSKIEPKKEFMSDWMEQVQKAVEGTLFPIAKNSWYLGANIPGKPQVFMPYVGGLNQYRKICDDVAATGYNGFQFST